MKTYKNMVAIPPGETIKDELEFLGMTQAEFAKRMGMAEKTISHLISGEAVLSYDTALKLETVLGIPASLWNNLESKYRELLLKIKEEETLEEEWNICQNFPFKEMMKRKWIFSVKENTDIIKEIRSFFAVASLNFLSDVEKEFFSLYEKKLLLFRKDDSKEISKFSMISWIRKGEIEANKIDTEPFSRSNIKELIPTIKKLSFNNSLENIDTLKELCRKNGIALVILPHLPKTFVNGVSKWLGKDKALIILSNKGKKIDAFWFNFFHELGHLLLHSKKELFINSDETQSLEIEEEANLFAKNTLIPKKEYESLLEFELDFSKDLIVDFAKKLEIHPSIVLGVLQYDKRITYKTKLNSLKEDILLNY